jgi:C6 transcription factor Pro1
LDTETVLYQRGVLYASLYGTISGTHPELPEIVGSVSKTVAALQRLTDPRLLRNLVWPFCISRCLALEEQYALFRDLFSVAEITQSTVGMCLEAFKIIEECWKIRMTCLGACVS